MTQSNYFQYLWMRKILLIVVFLLESCSDDPKSKRSGAVPGACSENTATCSRIDRVVPIVAKPGATITVYGENLAIHTKLLLEGSELDTDLIDAKTMTFVLPEGKSRLLSVEILDASNRSLLTSKLVTVLRWARHPIITVDRALVCMDIEFLDSNGDLKVGSKNCESAPACISDGELNCTTNATFAAASTEQLAGKVIAGQQVAGVSGSVNLSPTCSSDGQVGCVAIGPSYAAAIVTGAAHKILSGQSLAGVSGNVVLPLASKVLSSTSYGIGGTALTGNLTLPLASDVRLGSASYGEATALLTPSYNSVNCSADGQGSCVVDGTSYKAALLAGAAGKILLGQTLAGVSGLVIGESHSNCTAANQDSCVATATFKTMNLSAASVMTDLSSGNFNTIISTAANFEFWDSAGTRYQVAGDADLAAAKILSGENIFGVAGSVTAAPANCSANGSQSCVATGSYFAGTACAVNGSNCFVPTYVQTTQSLKAISYDAIDAGKASMRSSLTLSGIAGTLSDCSSDGDAGCVVVGPTYAALLKTNAQDKILSGQTIGSVAGNVTLPAVGKVLSGINFGVSGTGLSGTLTLPVAANVLMGSTAYGDPGAQVTPSFSPDFPSTSNVRASDTVNGAAGILNDCAAANQSDCVATTTYKTMDLASASVMTDLTSSNLNTSLASAANFEFWDSTGARYQANGTSSLAAANIATSITLFGVGGSATLESHSNCTAANQFGCLATTIYKTMNLTSAGTDTGLTAANFQARLAAAANSEFWDAVGARHSITGDANLSVGKVKSGVALFGVTGDYPSATYPLASNTAATDLTLFTTQLTTNGSFEFFDSAGAQYTGSGDSDLVAAKVKNAVDFENFSIIGTYVATLTCPTGWIKVPGDSAYGTNDFCVMKYEAKNVGSVATSQAASSPWVSITQIAAVTACRALGTGYDMISNAQWMTIGANVAARASNWTGGAPGTGYLFSGHNDNSPASACAASSNDALFYVETDCTPVSSGDATEQQRILTLSNGEVIWDLSGNVWEWVNYMNLGDKPGATAAWYEYSAVTGTTTTALKDLVPTNAVKAFWSNAWNSGQWIGRFFPGTNGSGGALQRGSYWDDGSDAGVFAAVLSEEPSYSEASFGFRCVLTAPTP